MEVQLAIHARVTQVFNHRYFDYFYSFVGVSLTIKIFSFLISYSLFDAFVCVLVEISHFIYNRLPFFCFIFQVDPYRLKAMEVAFWLALSVGVANIVQILKHLEFTRAFHQFAHGSNAPQEFNHIWLLFTFNFRCKRLNRNKNCVRNILFWFVHLNFFLKLFQYDRVSKIKLICFFLLFVVENIYRKCPIALLSDPMIEGSVSFFVISYFFLDMSVSF